MLCVTVKFCRFLCFSSLSGRRVPPARGMAPVRGTCRSPQLADWAAHGSWGQWRLGLRPWPPLPPPCSPRRHRGPSKSFVSLWLRDGGGESVRFGVGLGEGLRVAVCFRLGVVCGADNTQYANIRFVFPPPPPAEVSPPPSLPRFPSPSVPLLSRPRFIPLFSRVFASPRVSFLSPASVECLPSLLR